MTESEFCASCGGRCCFIYGKPYDESGKYNPEKVRRMFFNGDLHQYGVEPIESVDNRCNFLGENGCIIPKEKRPKICKEFRCSPLKAYLDGNENIDPSLENFWDTI